MAPAVAPARCEVQAITRPTKDSEIRLQVWLPVSGWNGKYLQVGNGGWAGSIDLTAMVDPLRRGYAVAATDNGHQSSGPVPGAPWAIGHPEKLIDFGYRAVHETSVQAKAIVRAHFGRDAGRGAISTAAPMGDAKRLMEAQRYPEEFDGIIAGAPANNWSHLFTGFVWNEQALAQSPIPAAKLPAIQNAVLASCDALDGVKDGLIEDPRGVPLRSGFNALQGRRRARTVSPRGRSTTLRKIYGGPKNPRTGKQIFPGYPDGHRSDSGWLVALDPAARPSGDVWESLLRAGGL